MKKKSLSKVLSMALAVTMVFSVAACGAEDNDQSVVSSQASEESKTTESGSAESSEAVPEELTYPLNTDHTLSVFNAASTLNSLYTSYTEDPTYMALQEATGVNAEWEHQIDGADYAQVFNLMLTDEELPDVILYNIANQADQMIEDGIVRDLTELIPEYAPDYWEYINSDPAILSVSASKEGVVQ